MMNSLMFSLIEVEERKKSHPDERPMVKEGFVFWLQIQLLPQWEGAGANLAKMRGLTISQAPWPSKRETDPVDTGCPSFQPDSSPPRASGFEIASAST